MSFFNAVYSDQDLSSRAKMVCLYLHDRANKDGESWYAIGSIARDLHLSRSHSEAGDSRPASIRMDREAAQIPGKWGMYLQSVPDTEVRTAQTRAVLHQGNTAPFLWTRGRVRVDRAEGLRVRDSSYSENQRTKTTPSCIYATFGKLTVWPALPPCGRCLDSCQGQPLILRKTFLK